MLLQELNFTKNFDAFVLVFGVPKDFRICLILVSGSTTSKFLAFICTENIRFSLTQNSRKGPKTCYQIVRGRQGTKT